MAIAETGSTNRKKGECLVEFEIENYFRVESLGRLKARENKALRYFVIDNSQ